MKFGLPRLDSCSSFAIEPIDHIQMVITSFSKSVDIIKVARAIIITDKVIIIPQLGTKYIIKGIWSASPLCSGARLVFEAVGKDFASVSRCLCERISNEWRCLHRLLKQSMGIWLQKILIDIQFTIGRDEGNDVLSGMPCYIDHAWEIISVSVVLA